MRWIYVLFLIPKFIFAQTWLQLADFPATERDDGVAVIVDDKAYFGTGVKTNLSYCGDFYALNLLNNTWSPIASMPEWSERQYACAFKGPGCFYVFSGDGYSGLLNNTYRYEIATNTWSLMASKPGNNLFGACVLEYGDKVIIVGGRTNNQITNNEVWEYTISSNTWLQKNNFPSNYGGSRWRGASAVLNNTGYLIFGLDANSSFRKELFSYDYNTDAWFKIMDFSFSPPRTYSAMKAMGDRLVLFAGCDSIGNFYNDLWFFNPVSSVSVWTQGPSLPSFARKGGMSCSKYNKFYYSCGIDKQNQRLKETWVLDLPVGLEELSFKSNVTENFIVYPNPSKQILNFEDRSGKSYGEFRVYLFDQLGKEIKSYRTSGRLGTIDIGGIEPGLYYLHIHSGEGDIEVKKIQIAD